MNITIAGGGNIGTQFAVHSAEKGHSVRIFTSMPGHFEKHLSIVDRSGKITHEGDIVLATDDPREAFCDAEMIMITMPPTMMIPLISPHGKSVTLLRLIIQRITMPAEGLALLP